VIAGSAIDLRTHLLKKTQLYVFEAFNDCGCFVEQLRRVGVGYRQAFHAGAAGAADAFLGVFDHHAVGGLDRFSVSAAGVERRQRFQINLRLGFALGHVFSARDEVGRGLRRINKNS